jgi:hypothetical protein
MQTAGQQQQSGDSSAQNFGAQKNRIGVAEHADEIAALPAASDTSDTAAIAEVPGLDPIGAGPVSPVDLPMDREPRSVTVMDSGSGEITASSLRDWTHDNPQRAAEWAAAQPEGKAREAMLDQVAFGWAEKDIRSALDWTDRLTPARSRARLRAALSMELARTSPLSALEVAATLDACAERDEACRHAAAQWALTDARSAIAWAEKTGDSALRTKLTETILSVWTMREPASAAAHVAAKSPPAQATEQRE